jgi:hypothetical protein
MPSSQAEIGSTLAQDVRVGDDALTVVLLDGRTLTVPLSWYPRLAHGSPKERMNWQLLGGGHGIHWPDLDEDISVDGLLAGRPSAESQGSLQKWLSSRAKRKQPSTASRAVQQPDAADGASRRPRR